MARRITWELPEPDNGWQIPNVGDHVDFRAEFGGEFTEMIVTGVDWDEEFRHDGNVWFQDDEGNVHRKRDANPSVDMSRLDRDTEYNTRQVRWHDSPGYVFPREG